MPRQSADSRRRHVLDAAIETFAAEGYRGASTTEIARRAGISQPYIYALYRNKHELFLAAYREVAERIRTRLLAAAETGDDPEARLRAMGVDLHYVGRDASASPATGSHQVHLREQRELVEAALAGGVPHLVRATTLIQRGRPAEPAAPPARPAAKAAGS